MDKKNKKVNKQQKGAKKLNFIVNLLELLFSIPFIICTILIAYYLVFGIYKVATHNTDTYYQVFYDEKREVNFFLYSDNEKEVQKMSHNDIVIGGWSTLIIVEIVLFLWLNIYNTIRNFLKNDNISKPFSNNSLSLVKKVKKYLLIYAFILIIYNIYVTFFFKYSLLLFLGDLNEFIYIFGFYAILDLVELLIKKGNTNLI